QSGTAGLYTFQGGGLPTGTAITNLVFATGSGSQIAGFALNPAGTVAYVADQRNSAGGIQKWTSNAGTWSLAYTFPTGAGAFAVAADFSGPAPVVYATTGESVSNRLVCVVDTNAAAVITLLATAGSNRAFRAVDWAPDLRPLIVSQPQSQVVTNGADASFSVTAESVYPLGYQWQLDGNVLDGATNATLTLSNVAAADQGAYQVWVTNQYGAVLSAEAGLTVNAVVVPPQFTLQPLSQTNAIGGTVTLAAAATGSEPLAWQWFFNSSPLPGETSATLMLNCLSPDQQGTYSVQVTNSSGSTNSDTAFVAVVVPPASFVAYTTPGMIYTQDFNDLPNPGTTSVNSDNPVSIYGAVYNLANPFDFAYPDLACGGLLGGLGQTSLAGWYGMGATAVKLGASAGDQSTGGIISFGLTNSDIVSANRALGLLATSSTGPTGFGVQLINETTNTLNQVTLHFTGELWRQAAVAKTIEFSYWIDLTATNRFTTNFTAALPALSVSFTPDPADTTPIPVDGTAAANQVELGVANHPMADWPPGAALWLVWRMTDPAGKGQGLA
ncbi:MAG: immunoglobulin domain-containing protein, partial [Limisphaerales bacterium]